MVATAVALGSASAATGAATAENAVNAALAAPVAFPGAEGAGAQAKGGRGGDVYYVTNLNDSGAGSLREGINTAPTSGRTILFKISGIINLQTGLSINRSNITIAGQTAPGDGITIRNRTIYVGEPPPRKPGSSLANNIIIRHLRLRLGQGTQATDQLDNIWVNSGSDIILDHISSSWSADEVLSASRDVKNLSVQNSLMYEALNKEGHAFGSIIDSGYDTTTRTTTTSGRTTSAGTRVRAPRTRIRGSRSTSGTMSSTTGATRSVTAAVDDKNIQLNYVNNYLTAGPSSTATCAMEGGDSSERIYQSGNKIDLNKNGKVDGTDTGWGMFCGIFPEAENAAFGAGGDHRLGGQCLPAGAGAGWCDAVAAGRGGQAGGRHRPHPDR